MRLIWHIARKDICRMALPVAVWLAFMLLSAIWFAVSAGTEMVVTAEDVNNWVGGTRVAVGLLAVVQGVICYFLIGAMVVEEPLVGSSAFWMTRPISNRRRAAATGVSSLVLFVIVPVLLLTALWTTLRFSPHEIGAASLSFVESQLVLVVLALVAAGVCRNLAQFLFCSVGLLIGYSICRIHLLAGHRSLEVTTADDRLITTGMMAAAVIVLVHQFITRRTLRTWRLVACAFVAAFVVRTLWPWNGLTFSPESAALGPKMALTSSPRLASGFDIRVGTAAANGWSRWPTTVDVTLPNRGAAVRIPLYGTIECVAPQDQRLVDLKLAQLRGADVASLVSGPAADATHWTLVGIRGPFGKPPAEPVQVCVVLWGYLARVLGTDVMSASSGGVRAGARETSIVATEAADDGSVQVLLRDRDAIPHGFLLSNRPDLGSSPAAFRHKDVFALVNYATHEARALECDDLMAIGFDGMIVGFRRVRIPGELHRGAWLSADIVRVRLELGDDFYTKSEVSLANSDHKMP